MFTTAVQTAGSRHDRCHQKHDPRSFCRYASDCTAWERLTKRQIEETINEAGRSTYPDEKSVLRNEATRQAQGHTVRLMAPQFVKSYVKSNKNDAADAAAICEAVGRPNMRFVPIKNIEQQAALSLHRVRQGFIRERTALANRIRGLLAEFGLIIPQGIHHIARRMPQILEDADNELSDPMRALLARLLEHLQELNRQVRRATIFDGAVFKIGDGPKQP
jgi:hypothetical protein